MRERTILSSFFSESEANRAAQKIREMGVEVAQVDQLHAYGGRVPERRFYAITGDLPSLAALSLNTDVTSRDTGILLGADPSASGMSDGQDNVTGRNWLLTVVCPEHQVEDAVRIIKECNGYT
ncbi:hypothetical protein [Alicyclobacillus pomorum]|jgi:hypothetical protein|uniref:hypothetical protein n=1 Tax=Alicyclobacillus pomorum TaxID=204470 RepID=UPI00041D3C9C|nr:hypothetical protein [Alicyclobacillus pomorum]